VGAYPVLASLALTASAAGAGITFGLLAWVGPRWTRFAARVMATLFGAVSFLSTQARFLVPDGMRQAAWHAMRPGTIPAGPQWWPARAVLGEPMPMLALASVGVSAVLLASAALGQAYGTGVLNGIALPRGVRSVAIERRFRHGVFGALVGKEWTLLRRHPGLAAQVFYQFVFLVPGAVALMRMGGGAAGNGGMPGGVVFLTALMTGRIAKIILAGPYEADHAAALAATSPVDLRLAGRAKLLVTMGALAVVGGLPLVAIAVRLPHAFPAALLACTGAASTRVWLAASGRRVLKKQGLRGRLSMTSDGLLGVMIDVGWGVFGAVLSRVSV
jgi:ABC-2 type transport system permease protein